MIILYNFIQYYKYVLLTFPVDWSYGIFDMQIVK